MPDAQPVPPRGTFWVQELHGPPAAPVVASMAVTFRRAGPEDAEALAALLEFGRDEVEARLQSGRWCYAGVVAGALAVCGWTSFDREGIGEQGLQVRLAPDEAYIWNCVTVPKHRRRGLYTALLQHIAGDLRAVGLRRVWIGADADNLPSQKGMARAGFKPVLDLYTEVSGGGRRHQVERRPGVTAELLAEAQRVLFGQ